MVEPQVSTLKMGVRAPLAAPTSRHIEFELISSHHPVSGIRSPLTDRYHIIPVYAIKANTLKHKNNMEWIEESLTETWSWFSFGGYPDPGITYCFKRKEDAGMFTLCRCASTDGLNSIKYHERLSDLAQ